ncbi:hypothetical protein JL722_12907 [Aureococcus anophagefferens]|nr:hypothetical protein JL722_12907 [Aureococcus anophagefferens]
MAFSADLRYDPFAEDLRSTKQPAAPVGSAVAAMRAKQDDAGAGGFDETSLEDDRLPEAVLRCFREAAGGGPQAFYDAVSDLYTPEEEAAGANEADVVVAHPNVWEKYFEAKLDEVFRGRRHVLGQEKRVVVAPEDDRYGSGKHAIAIRATHADGCSFAVYAATTGATKASVASEPMRALEPRLRKLKLLGEMGAARSSATSAR